MKMCLHGYSGYEQKIEKYDYSNILPLHQIAGHNILKI